METFGEWLRRQRQRLKLTREQLAERVGCSVALLRKIEDGERRPSTQIAELLANGLNIPPADRATFVRVARGELGTNRLPQTADQTADSDTPPASAAPRVNLPVLPTPLIGRQREVTQLIGLLRDPQCRLLTLVGPGGMGKTRLAIETASQMQADFAQGVFFIPLAQADAPRFLVPLIADAIGFAFSSAAAADPKAQLFSYLKAKQILLVLDNLEQLLAEPGIEVLADLLADAPRVTLLATSRETLGLQGEWVFEVQGLPIPEGDSAEQHAPDTSVELFLQRARRVRVGFTAAPGDFPAIVRICHLVGGMPLGIELAAAWVRTLSCNEIAQEVEHGLDFLSISARDLPARHRSMRAVFDHSWQLLSAEEQNVLLRLSVLRGGFRREAAQEVAGATLPVLSALVTKSLVRRSGDGRYDLHELIRQLAVERFSQQPEEQMAAQARHAGYYLTAFAHADQRLRSAAQPKALMELSADMDNFRAAWAWAVGQGEFALIEQTLRALAMFYDTRSWWQEGLETLGHLITTLETARAPSAPDVTAQLALGHSLAAYAVLASRLGKYEQARAMLERSLEILRPLDQPWVLAESVTFLGTVMELSGEYGRAWELYSEAERIATAIGDRWFTVLCFTLLTGLAGFIHARLTPEDTYERLRAAVAEWRAIGDPRFTAIALNNFSHSALRAGRPDEARAALEESVALNDAVGDRWGLGYAYRGLSLIAQAQGEHQQALDMFRKGLDTLAELGARSDVARLLAEMGRSYLALGNEVEAERAWREALRLALDTRGLFVALEAMTGMARLEAQRGHLDQALEWLLVAENHPSALHETRHSAAQLRAEVEARVSGQQAATARSRAQTQSLDDVAADILKAAGPA